MAYLIPENISSRGDVPAQTQGVARALRDELGEEVTVWLEREPQREDEPHLLILDPSAGVILLGVPRVNASGFERVGEELAYVSGSDLWSSLEARSDLFEKRFALEQRLVADLPVAIAFAFPTLDRSKVERLGLSPDETAHLLLEEDFADGQLPEGLRRLAGEGPEAPLTDKEERVARGLLHPEIVIDSLGAASSAGQLVFAPPQEDGEDIVRVLDRQQERLARDLGGGYRVIRGVAGSGKTLVLAFRARFLAEQFRDWQILLTCFNICLAQSLSQLLSDVPNIRVKHIDSHAHYVLQLAGIHRKNRTPEDWTAARIQAADSLKKRPENRQYDVVLVDEGQDFDGPGFDLAFASLKDGRDHFVVALDAAQNIYRKKDRWHPPEQSARGRTTVLRTNYRNTREILEFAYWFLTLDRDASSVDELLDDPGEFVPPEATVRRGPIPQVLACRNLEAEIDAICDALVRNHDLGIRWSDMVVLYGSRDQQKALFFETKRRGIPYFWVTMSAKSKREILEHGDVVRASTIQAMKGLEFSRVFMCGVNDVWDPSADEAALRRLVYVGMTRAVDELVITISGDGMVGRDIQRTAGR